MRRLVTLLTMVTLATAAGLVAPRPASACSCIEIDPSASIGSYPAAFVGTLVDVDGQVGAVLSSDAETIYRFEVETWVKGDLGEIVEIHSAANGASCGIEVLIGNRAGIFVNVDGGVYRSSLCETVDADVLLAASKPLAVGAPGPPRLFISARVGGYEYLMVNEDGGIVEALGIGGTDMYDRPWQFSACPGGRLNLEMWGQRIVVRDLSDLSIVHDVDLTEFAGQIAIIGARCMAEDGSSIYLVGDDWDGERSTVRVYEALGGPTPLFEIPTGQAKLAPGYAVVQEYLHNNRLVVHEFGTDETRTIHEVDPNGEPYVGIAAWSISPDADRIAVLVVTYHSGAPQSEVLMYTPAGVELGRVAVEAEGWGIEWIDADRLVVQTNSADYTHPVGVVLDASTLSTVVELDGWQATDALAHGGTLFGRDGGRLIGADLATGHVDAIATFAVQYLGPIALLPEGFEMSATAPGPGDATAPPDTVPPVTVVQSAVDPGEEATKTARLVLSVLGVIGIGGLGLAVRRRRQPSHPI